MKKTSGLLFFVGFTLLLSACGAKPLMSQPMSLFSFTDQNNQAFGSEDLMGKIWIADFIFTDCQTVCIPMMSETAGLQRQFKKLGIQVEFVSFTVDPTVDSPEVLNNYIKQFTDDESNWHMLTGYSQEDVGAFARKAFNTIVMKPDKSKQVIHGTSFYLVNPDGLVMNEYSYTSPAYLDSLIEDVIKLDKKFN